MATLVALLLGLLYGAFAGGVLGWYMDDWRFWTGLILICIFNCAIISLETRYGK